MLELDGGQRLESVEYDDARTTYLMNWGFATIRFWNNQVLNEMAEVKEAILLALKPI